MEQPLTKTFLLPNLLPRILITWYFFRNVLRGWPKHSGRPIVWPWWLVSQIFHVIQPARITVLISDFASPESFNAVFTGSSARRKSSSSVDISFQMFEGIIRICKIWNAKALRKHNRFISLLGGSGIPVKVWVETVGMLPVVGLRFFWMNFCGASPGVTATLVHPEATSGSSADYHTIKDQKNKRTKSTPSFKTW